MRDRLIELIDNACQTAKLHDKTRRINEQVADYLLENGVIAPPVKIRTKIYKTFQGKIYEYEVASYTVDVDGCSFIHLAYLEGSTVYGVTHSIEEFNKQYYLTRKEAEKALEGGEGDG